MKHVRVINKKYKENERIKSGMQRYRVSVKEEAKEASLK